MDFPYEYRAEVLGDAVDRAADQRSGSCSPRSSPSSSAYLLLQAATGSWRGAAVLLVAAAARRGRWRCWPPSSSAVCWPAACWPRSSRCVALALRQSLVLVRRAQESAGPSTPAGRRDAAGGRGSRPRRCSAPSRRRRRCSCPPRSWAAARAWSCCTRSPSPCWAGWSPRRWSCCSSCRPCTRRWPACVRCRRRAATPRRRRAPWSRADAGARPRPTGSTSDARRQSEREAER